MYIDIARQAIQMAADHQFKQIQEQQIMSMYGSPDDMYGGSGLVRLKVPDKKPVETFDYKPGFKWLAFRAGHNAYAQQSEWTTQTLINFVMYCQSRKEAA